VIRDLQSLKKELENFHRNKTCSTPRLITRSPSMQIPSNLYIFTVYDRILAIVIAIDQNVLKVERDLEFKSKYEEEQTTMKEEIPSENKEETFIPLLERVEQKYEDSGILVENMNKMDIKDVEGSFQKEILSCLDTGSSKTEFNVREQSKELSKEVNVIENMSINGKESFLKRKIMYGIPINKGSQSLSHKMCFSKGSVKGVRKI